jgi:hypothetical protein
VFSGHNFITLCTWLQYFAVAGIEMASRNVRDGYKPQEHPHSVSTPNNMKRVKPYYEVPTGQLGSKLSSTQSKTE